VVETKDGFVMIRIFRAKRKNGAIAVCKPVLCEVDADSKGGERRRSEEKSEFKTNTEGRQESFKLKGGCREQGIKRCYVFLGGVSLDRGGRGSKCSTRRRKTKEDLD
jgi:hypothetical protein